MRKKEGRKVLELFLSMCVLREFYPREKKGRFERVWLLLARRFRRTEVARWSLWVELDGLLTGLRRPYHQVQVLYLHLSAMIQSN